MKYLTNILDTKREEVARLKVNEATFDTSTQREIRSLRNAIVKQERLAIISEIKRKSPSKGLILAETDPVSRAKVYEQAGAAAISVLTDVTYFGGSTDDLTAVRNQVSIPVLRKDFIVDEIQIDEAYHIGADAILLIAAALAPDRLRELSLYAQKLGLEVLLEVHGVDELDAALAANPSVLGVNNRNLHTFEVDLATTARILDQLPTGTVAIAESGVMGPDDARYLASIGAEGILVGELLMRHPNLQDVTACLQGLQVQKSAVRKS